MTQPPLHRFSSSPSLLDSNDDDDRYHQQQQHHTHHQQQQPSYNTQQQPHNHHNHQAHTTTSHHRRNPPTATDPNANRHFRRRAPDAHEGRDDFNDPIHSSRRALHGTSSKLPATDLHNVNRWYVLLASILGLLLAVALVQSGANSKQLALWVKLPGDLFMDAMLCVVVPTIFLNSILASMHFWTLNKAKALGYKMLAYFALTTLWASAVGTLVAVCFVPLFNSHNLPQTGNAATGSSMLGKAPIRFRCSGGLSSSSSSSIVMSDGSLRCQAAETAGSNSTLFLLQPLSTSFQLRGDLRNNWSTTTIKVLSLAETAMQLIESFFPANGIQSFLQGDILSVIVMGVALGMALIHKSSIRTREFPTPGGMTPILHHHSNNNAWAGQLFVLVLQCEVLLSVLLRCLLRVLPIAMVFLVAGGILDAHAVAPLDEKNDSFSPTAQDLVMIFAVVLFALLLQLVTVLAMAMVLTKSNPIKFLQHLLPAQLVALGAVSSLVALPTTVRSIAATKQVSMPLAHFVCSTGAVLNKHGSALYLSVASVYIVATTTTTGVRDEYLTTSNLVLLVFVSALCSCVVPPMPRGNLALMPTILSSVFGVPNSDLARMVVFLMAMDWLLDPLVTSMNVTANALIALILAVQMDESFVEFGVVEAEMKSDTQEEDSNDGFPLDESARLVSTNARVTTDGYAARPGTQGTGTVRSAMLARMSSVGESLVSV